MTGALSGAPIGLDVLTVGGGVLTPGSQCSQQADGFSIAVAKGITIGGNSIDGLGADGLSANAGEIGSIALGNSASTGALATRSIALGSGANVTGASSNAIAIGTTASAQGASATAIGSSAQALGVSTVAIGTAATATAAQQVAIGQAAGGGAGLGATGAVSLGYAAGTNVQGAQNVGIGAGAGVFTGAGTGVSGARNVAIGSTDGVVAAAGTGVSGDDNVAIGTGAGLAVTSAGTVSIGRNAVGSATGSVALGTGATTNVANSVALGSGSTITGAPTGLSFQTATAAPVSQVEVGGRRITGVSGGAAPTDVVNVSQLLGTANNLATTLGGSFNAAGVYTPPTYTTAAGTTATTVQGALANETAATTQLGNAAAANVGAGATYTPATGVLSAPSFSVANISATGAVGAPTVATNTGAAVAGLSTDVTNLANGLTSGAIGLVQQAVPAAPITVGATTGGTSVDLTGTSGPRRLSGVGAGLVATDAVNLGQVTAAVGTATANGVQYDAPGGIRANSVTLVGGLPGAVTVTNVAPGSLAAGSTDAVNGSQLFAANAAIDAQGAIVSGLGFGVAGQLGGGTAYNPVTGLLGGGTYRAGTTGGTYATVAAALASIVTGPEGSDPSAVHYTDATHTAITLGNAGAAPVGIANVADGNIAAGSHDAVNGGQLATTNGNVTANSLAVTNLTNQIAEGTVGLVQQTGGPGAGAITIGAGTAGTVISAANNTGAARRLTAVAAGAVTAASVDAVNGSQLFAVSQAQTAASALSVQYTADAAGNPTAAIDLTKGGTIAATTVSGVAAGAVTTASTQAVNGAQLYSTNAHVAGDTAALGGGAAYNAATGTYTSPTYTVQGAAMNTVGGAVAALDSAVGRALTATASGVRYDDATRTSLTLNAGGPATTLHNVAPGVAAGDAVNVAQLQSASNATLASADGYTDQHVAALSYDLRRRVDATGAKGAALAGVPQSINPGSGFIGASVGGQGAEFAFALGVSRVFDAAHMPVIKAGVSVDARGYSASYNVGAGIHF